MTINAIDSETLIFYGGEPLLNQEFIKRLIEDTRGNGLRYLLHTNGSLLNQIDRFVGFQSIVWVLPVFVCSYYLATFVPNKLRRYN
jgi:organic radical activating enzyme